MSMGNQNENRFAGIQIGVFGNSNAKTYGLQIGATNDTNDLYGIQISVWNKSKKVRGLQIGLWNIIEKRKFPLVNW